MDDVSELIETATERTGLTDFGDESFRDGLQRLVRALRNEANLNAVGQLAMPAVIVNLLCQRLQIEDWYRRHPEIDDERIAAPLIGLGLPRTGSTALSFLLGEDSRARSLRCWEARKPCPPPATVEGPDPRIAETEAEIAIQKQLMPRIDDLLPVTATGPYECQDFMALDFKSQLFQAFAVIPSYSSWVLDADLQSTYHYELRVLKLLQWRSPVRPWRLKSPSHLLWLAHLDKVFPDARFVMTHRDPTEVIVSVADLYGELTAQFSDDVDRRYLGSLNVEHWTVGMRRAIEFRETQAADRFFDMDFHAIQQHPIDEVRRLYAWLGEPVSDEFEVNMRRWWQDNATARTKNIHPDPASFGLDLDAIRPQFADYTNHVGEWIRRAGQASPAV